MWGGAGDRAGPRRAGQRDRRATTSNTHTRRALLKLIIKLRFPMRPPIKLFGLWRRQGQKKKEQIMPEDAEPYGGMRDIKCHINIT
jgi:hypothetical protein